MASSERDVEPAGPVAAAVVAGVVEVDQVDRGDPAPRVTGCGRRGSPRSCRRGTPRRRRRAAAARRRRAHSAPGRSSPSRGMQQAALADEVGRIIARSDRARPAQRVGLGAAQPLGHEVGVRRAARGLLPVEEGEVDGRRARRPRVGAQRPRDAEHDRHPAAPSLAPTKPRAGPSCRSARRAATAGRRPGSDPTTLRQPAGHRARSARRAARRAGAARADAAPASRPAAARARPARGTSRIARGPSKRCARRDRCASRRADGVVHAGDREAVDGDEDQRGAEHELEHERHDQHPDGHALSVSVVRGDRLEQVRELARAPRRARVGTCSVGTPSGGGS